MMEGSFHCGSLIPPVLGCGSRVSAKVLGAHVRRQRPPLREVLWVVRGWSIAMTG